VKIFVVRVVLTVVDQVVLVYLVVVIVVDVVLEVDLVVVVVDVEAVVVSSVLLLFGPTATEGKGGNVPAGTFLFCTSVVAAVVNVIFVLAEAVVVKVVVLVRVDVGVDMTLVLVVSSFVEVVTCCSIPEPRKGYICHEIICGLHTICTV
jgi:hypothetical protein